MIAKTKSGYDYIELWKELMRNHEGVIPERMKDDRAEEAFWASVAEKKKQHKVDPYAQVVQWGFFRYLTTTITYWKSDRDGGIIRLLSGIRFES
ncbi:hypothetical protein [Ectobacillus panaciterrae]|uniref:hypothetical protein n=1 Tax=Ectobacillus panaciterrae TaxID=363872 RepID=UPI000411AF27|nr:hypothetical protein [Ectobacillus panaciterrae]